MGNKKRKTINFTVAELAKEQHEELHKTATPAQLALVKEATEAMQEIENIFWGNTREVRAGVLQSTATHSDELIEWIENAGVEPERLSLKIKEMKIGEILTISTRAFIKTPNNEFQEVGGYINRLEKILLAKLQEIKQLQSSEKPKIKSKGRLRKK